MKRLCCFLTLFAAALSMTTGPARAERLRPGLLRQRVIVHKPAVAADRPSPSDRPRPDDADWRQPELYPQYYGGFHYRTLQNYGYPTGDIGVRGSAW